MDRKTFLESYATALFPIQAYPSRWQSLSVRLLVHECRHTTHCVWLGYLVPIIGWIPGDTGRHIRAWCGAPLYAALYLFFLLPTIFSIGRLLIELDADAAAWRWQLKHGHKIADIIDRARSFGERVCSGRYMWAWLKCLGGVWIFEKVAFRTIRRVPKSVN